MKQMSINLEEASWDANCIDGKTEEQFITEHMNNQYKKYPEELQRELLREAYRLIKLAKCEV